MHSLTKLVEGASIPELKEAIRLFQARCPGSNELSQNLSGILQFEEKDSTDGLRGVIKGVCEAFQECRGILEELLGGDEDAQEEFSRSWVLDGSQEEGDGFELKMVRTKSKKNGKRKRDILSSPPKPKKMKKVKSAINDSAQRHGGSKLLLPEIIPSWWPDVSIVQNKRNISSSSSALPSSESKRKRTIEEIFEADIQRREVEALKEIERRRYEAEIQAQCAQCKAHFLTDENWMGSCVFHPGE
jgi:hypothetical protein